MGNEDALRGRGMMKVKNPFRQAAAGCALRTPPFDSALSVYRQDGKRAGRIPAPRSWPAHPFQSADVRLPGFPAGAPAIANEPVALSANPLAVAGNDFLEQQRMSF